MKAKFRLFLLACGLLGSASVARAEPVSLRYAVSFKDAVVATQSVVIAQADGLTTVACSFAADLPVFIAMHRYSEDLSVSFRPDGTVVRLAARIQDGPVQTVVAGSLEGDGALHVVRTDMEGVSTNVVAREDYDFHSLIFYGRPPTEFLPTNGPARVLSVAQGRILPVAIQANAESDTFERQYLVSTHLVWTEGAHVSHSWHPERFSNLPRRYVRRTESGEFTFALIR